MTFLLTFVCGLCLKKSVSAKNRRPNFSSTSSRINNRRRRRCWNIRRQETRRDESILSRASWSLSSETRGRVTRCDDDDNDDDDELGDVGVEFVVVRINYPPVILTNVPNFLISWPCFEMDCSAQHLVAFEGQRPQNVKSLDPVIVSQVERKLKLKSQIV